jgi:hypothetical protein
MIFEIITQTQSVKRPSKMNSLGTSTSVEKQMDQLESVFNWYVLTVLIAFYAGAHATPSVEVLGVKVEKDEAYSLILLLFNFVFLIFCHLVWKIGDWLKYCDAADLEGELAALFNHKWLLNPFEYCGPDWLGAINCSVGAGFLFFLWWAGFAALRLLNGVSTRKFWYDPTLTTLVLLLCVIGILCVAVMGRVYHLIFVKLRDRSSDESVQSLEWVRTSLMRSVWIKCASSTVGAALGGLLYLLCKDVA